MKEENVMKTIDGELYYYYDYVYWIYDEMKTLQERIDKAFEYINKVKILNEEYKEDWTFKVFVPILENILQGEDTNVKDN